MIAEIPDATPKKNTINNPKKGVPNTKASKTIKQKAMIAIFLNLNDFSLGQSIAINFSAYNVCASAAGKGSSISQYI